jgi:hypothetical protein
MSIYHLAEVHIATTIGQMKTIALAKTKYADTMFRLLLAKRIERKRNIGGIE